jgi:uncharacterized protein HemX
MSDSNSLMTRVAALLVFIALGAGVFAFMKHNDLKAMEQQLATVQQEHATLRTELVNTEKTVLANSTAVQTCTKEMETYKTRAQTAETALEEMKAPKRARTPRSAL